MIDPAMPTADQGWRQAAVDDPHLRHAVNVAHGHVTHAAVASSLGFACVDVTPLHA